MISVARAILMLLFSAPVLTVMRESIEHREQLENSTNAGEEVNSDVIDREDVVESVGRYHERRWNVLQEISGTNIPMCMWCGKLLHVDVDKLHVHHVNPEEGHEPGIGGWQHLLRIEEDLENDVEMQVLYHSCHAWEHDNQVLWTPKLEVRP